MFVYQLINNSLAEVFSAKTFKVKKKKSDFVLLRKLFINNSNLDKTNIVALVV